MMDIALTLLIIFVIVAPVLHGGVTINLPRANAQPLRVEGEHLTISIDYDGKVYLNNDTTAVPDLESAVIARTMGDRTTPVFVKADKNVKYESVFFVLSTLKEMDYQKVSLVSTMSSPQNPIEAISSQSATNAIASEGYPSAASTIND